MVWRPFRRLAELERRVAELEQERRWVPGEIPAGDHVDPQGMWRSSVEDYRHGWIDDYDDDWSARGYL